MGKFIEFSSSDRKVTLVDTRLPLYGAICKTLIAKGSTSPFTLSQNKDVTQATDSVAETSILSDIRVACRSLTGNTVSSPVLAADGDKFKVIDTELAEQIVNASKGLTVQKMLSVKITKNSKPVAGKRGRPAGAEANRGPKAAKPAKGLRFRLEADGTKVQLGRGKPSPYWTIVNDSGKVLQKAAPAKVKAAKVSRAPTAKVAKVGRFYMLDGVLTPFGAGRPSAVKLENECDSAGLHIANVAAVKLTPAAKKAVANQEVASLKSELSDLKAMMAMFLKAQGISMPVAEVVAETPVVPEVVETVAEVATVAPVKAEKPAKVAKAKVEKPVKAPRVVKPKIVNDDDDLAGDDSEFIAESSFSMDSDGFVVTDCE